MVVCPIQALLVQVQTWQRRIDELSAATEQLEQRVQDRQQESTDDLDRGDLEKLAYPDDIVGDPDDISGDHGRNKEEERQQQFAPQDLHTVNKTGEVLDDFGGVADVASSVKLGEDVLMPGEDANEQLPSGEIYRTRDASQDASLASEEPSGVPAIGQGEDTELQGKERKEQFPSGEIYITGDTAQHTDLVSEGLSDLATIEKTDDVQLQKKEMEEQLPGSEVYTMGEVSQGIAGLEPEGPVGVANFKTSRDVQLIEKKEPQQLLPSEERHRIEAGSEEIFLEGSDGTAATIEKSEDVHRKEQPEKSQQLPSEDTTQLHRVTEGVSLLPESDGVSIKLEDTTDVKEKVKPPQIPSDESDKIDKAEGKTDDVSEDIVDSAAVEKGPDMRPKGKKRRRNRKRKQQQQQPPGEPSKEEGREEPSLEPEGAKDKVAEPALKPYTETVKPGDLAAAEDAATAADGETMKMSGEGKEGREQGDAGHPDGELEMSETGDSTRKDEQMKEKIQQFPTEDGTKDEKEGKEEAQGEVEDGETKQGKAQERPETLDTLLPDGGKIELETLDTSDGAGRIEEKDVWRKEIKQQLPTDTMAKAEEESREILEPEGEAQGVAVPDSRDLELNYKQDKERLPSEETTKEEKLKTQVDLKSEGLTDGAAAIESKDLKLKEKQQENPAEETTELDTEKDEIFVEPDSIGGDAALDDSKDIRRKKLHEQLPVDETKVEEEKEENFWVPEGTASGTGLVETKDVKMKERKNRQQEPLDETTKVDRKSEILESDDGNFVDSTDVMVKEKQKLPSDQATKDGEGIMLEGATDDTTMDISKELKERKSQEQLPAEGMTKAESETEDIFLEPEGTADDASAMNSKDLKAPEKKQPEQMPATAEIGGESKEIFFDPHDTTDSASAIDNKDREMSENKCHEQLPSTTSVGIESDEMFFEAEGPPDGATVTDNRDLKKGDRILQDQFPQGETTGAEKETEEIFLEADDTTDAVTMDKNKGIKTDRTSRKLKETAREAVGEIQGPPGEAVTIIGDISGSETVLEKGKSKVPPEKSSIPSQLPPSEAYLQQKGDSGALAEFIESPGMGKGQGFAVEQLYKREPKDQEPADHRLDQKVLELRTDDITSTGYAISQPSVDIDKPDTATMIQDSDPYTPEKPVTFDRDDIPDSVRDGSGRIPLPDQDKVRKPQQQDPAQVNLSDHVYTAHGTYHIPAPLQHGLGNPKSGSFCIVYRLDTNDIYYMHFQNL